LSRTVIDKIWKLLDKQSWIQFTPNRRYFSITPIITSDSSIKFIKDLLEILYDGSEELPPDPLYGEMGYFDSSEETVNETKLRKVKK